MNKFLSIALVLALLFTSVMLFSTQDSNSALPPDSSSGKAQVGGAFSLLDTNEKTVTDKQFRGQYMLVFFGFTHCPDICPTTMATLTRTMEMLGDKAKLITPIMISVDAKNDTPKQMKKYLSNFDSRIVGLTGSEEQIKSAAAAYKAYYAEVAPEKNEHDEHHAHGEHSEHTGMMDHSGLLYLMDKNGEYITHFSYDIAPEQLAKTLAEKMS